MKNLKKLIALIIFLSLISLKNLDSQKLRARIDQVTHLDLVKEMVVSPDKKLFATADDFGMVVLKDVETGKIIANHKYEGKIYDLFFTKNEGEILAIYKTDIKDENIFAEAYDFLNQKTTHLKIFNNNFSVRPEVDFNPKTNTILLSTDNHYALTYNLETQKKDSIHFELKESIASFLDNEKIEFICRESNFTEPKVYEYNYNTNTLIEIEQDSIELSYLEFDKNNKYMFRTKGVMTFSDAKLNYTYKLREDDFYFKNKRIEKTNAKSPAGDRIFDITISNFAFSPDGKHIALSGGQGTIKSKFGAMSPYSKDEVGTGYVALYSVEGNRLIWRTKNKNNQTKFDTNDLDWINNKTIITCDEKGNTFFYDISQDRYNQAYLLPKEYCTSSDISKDFSTLTYGLYGFNTMKLEATRNSQITEITENFQDFIKILEPEKILHCTEKLKKDNDIFNIYKSNKSIPEELVYKDKLQDIVVSDKVSYACYTTQNNMQTIMLEVDSLIKNKFGMTIGFVSRGFNYYYKNIDPNIKVGSFFDVKLKTILTIVNLNNTNAAFSIINENTDKVQFSKNEKYLSILQKKKRCQIFNIETKQFIHSEDSGPFSLKLNFFDKQTDLAFGINNDYEFIVWNTKNETILTKDKIKKELHKKFDDNMDFIREAEINNVKQEVIFKSKFDFHIYNYREGELTDVENESFVQYYEISPGGKHVYTHAYDDVNKLLLTRIKNMNTDSLVYETKKNEVHDEDEFNGNTLPVYFHATKPLAFLHDKYSRFTLFDLEKETTLATLKLFPNGEWVVFTPNGIFDGSKEGRKALYYLAGTEVILYDQLKETYWESDLLNKLINNPESIGSFSSNKNIALHPLVTIQKVKNKSDFSITLKERSGGIGKVSFYINGKELIEDINPQREKNITINIDSFSSRLIPFETNNIGIKAYNEEGWLSGRVVNSYFTITKNIAKGVTNIDDKITVKSSRRSGNKKIGLHGLFIGTSQYDNEDLNLDFADKDANVLTDAFSKVSASMYDKSNINLKVLSSSSTDPNLKSTKQNIISSLQDIANKANVNDIIVLFFSGHGMTIEDDFYYLTSPAGNIDIQANSSRRSETCVSSKEIQEALRKIKSNKQIMILDACHSGQITKILDGGAKALTTSQQKALESLEDKMGVYILASSESNQKSFESSSLQQGLLTFTILRGLSGEAATQDSIINVVDLLNYASLESENISKKILKKVQRPVLGIAKGGSSFPIGIENKSLRVEILDNKKQFSNPNFAVSPHFNDPQQLESTMLSQLSERGSIGSQEKFIYVSKSTDNAHQITGTYTVEGNTIVVKWHLIKANQKIAGPFESTNTLTNKIELIDSIIDQAVEEIK